MKPSVTTSGPRSLRHSQAPQIRWDRIAVVSAMMVAAAGFGTGIVRGVHKRDALIGQLSQPRATVEAGLADGTIDASKVAAIPAPEQGYPDTIAGDISREGKGVEVKGILDAQNNAAGGGPELSNTIEAGDPQYVPAGDVAPEILKATQAPAAPSSVVPGNTQSR